MILYKFFMLILSNICIILCKVHMMSKFAMQSSFVVSKKIILFVSFCNLKYIKFDLG